MKQRYNGKHPKTGKKQICTTTGKGTGRGKEVIFSDGSTSTIGKACAVKVEGADKL